MPRDLERQATQAFRVDHELKKQFRIWVDYIDGGPNPDAPDLSAASLTTVLKSWRNHMLNLTGEITLQLDRVSDEASDGDLREISNSSKTAVDDIASKLNTLVTVTDEADPDHPYPNPKNSVQAVRDNLLQGINPNTGNKVYGGEISAQPASEVLRSLVANADTPTYDGNAAEDSLGDLIAYLGEEAPNLTSV